MMMRRRRRRSVSSSLWSISGSSPEPDSVSGTTVLLSRAPRRLLPSSPPFLCLNLLFSCLSSEACDVRDTSAPPLLSGLMCFLRGGFISVRAACLISPSSCRFDVVSEFNQTVAGLMWAQLIKPDLPRLHQLQHFVLSVPTSLRQTPLSASLLQASGRFTTYLSLTSGLTSTWCLKVSNYKHVLSVWT